MNYVQIQQFLVLAKTMNMTKAAKELYITQPALSHSLSKMEDELGIQLVYRDGNRLVMTEEGREILRDFEEISRSYEKMQVHAKNISEKKREKLVMGFAGSPTAFASLYTYGLLTEYNGISIEKIFADHATISDMLQNGLIDFAITFPPITRDNVESRILVRDPIRLALAAGHPLLRQLKVTLEDLRPYALLALPKDNPFSRLCEDFLQRKNLTLSFLEYSYSELVSAIRDGKNDGRSCGLTSQKQFSGWFGKGYRCIPIADCDEAIVTAISWLNSSGFGYRYKELVQSIEKGYDRVYYRNYRILKPEK